MEYNFCQVNNHDFFPALVLSLLIALTLGCGSGSVHTEPAQMVFPAATVPLTKLSSDPYTNSTSQHATEVEPDTFAFGSTIVTAFQVGRIHGGGASDIGFATDRKSTRLNSSHDQISYAVFCLKKKIE